MLANYDFEGATLEAQAKTSKQLEQIAAVFDKMRAQVKAECKQTSEMLNSRFDLLEDTMNLAYRRLYARASPRLKKRIEAAHGERPEPHRNGERKVGVVKPCEEADKESEEEQAKSSDDIAFGFNEEEDDDDIFS